MEHAPGNVTPTIIHTPATSSAESDPEPGPKDQGKSKEMPASDEKNTAQTEPLTRQNLANIHKSLSIETSTPSSSRNSSLVAEDVPSSQDKETLSDGPTSCSTPVSNDSEEMASAHRGFDRPSSTTSRPVDLDIEGSIASQMTMGSSQTFHSAITFVEPELQVPIVGYEIMEQRAKFTVFKLHVQLPETDNWFIFRRYTDFVRLNDRLRVLYPGFRLSLPPKRWFGSNFDPNFLEDRQLGLQAFINNITGHKDIVQSDPVREFLCLDDPPGAHDSLEESRALCESLEETVYNLRKDLAERDSQLAHAKLELSAARQRIAALLSEAEKAGVQLSSTDITSSPSMESDSSAVDFCSRIEADQAVRPLEHRQEHRSKEQSSNIITLSSERNIFNSPNCNINNSTEYSVNGLTSLNNTPGTSVESTQEESKHSAIDDGDRNSPADTSGGIINVT